MQINGDNRLNIIFLYKSYIQHFVQIIALQFDDVIKIQELYLLELYLLESGTQCQISQSQLLYDGYESSIIPESSYNKTAGETGEQILEYMEDITSEYQRMEDVMRQVRYIWRQSRFFANFYSMILRQKPHIQKQNRTKSQRIRKLGQQNLAKLKQLRSNYQSAKIMIVKQQNYFFDPEGSGHEAPNGEYLFNMIQDFETETNDFNNIINILEMNCSKIVSIMKEIVQIKPEMEKHMDRIQCIESCVQFMKHEHNKVTENIEELYQKAKYLHQCFTDKYDFWRQ